MIGRELNNTFPERIANEQGEVLLEAQELTGNGVKNISFQLHRGEILGFAGLIGAGRTELAELIFGVKPITSGKLFWKGHEVRFASPHTAINAGIYLVPEDRKRQGALLPMSIQQNITVSVLPRISHASVIDRIKDSKTAQFFSDKLRIKTPSLLQAVKNLSGGNQQKVVLAKGLATDPELIIFDEPTRGIDVGAKYEIYCLMNQLKSEGKTILMISSEMEEIIGMSDRIIVLAEGHISGEIARKDFSQEKIMRLASREMYNME
jgi:ribose transport system ATP-binding protein